jgi:hypothetical protein
MTTRPCRMMERCSSVLRAVRPVRVRAERKPGCPALPRLAQQEFAGASAAGGRAPVQDFLGRGTSAPRCTVPAAPACSGCCATLLGWVAGVTGGIQLGRLSAFRAALRAAIRGGDTLRFGVHGFSGASAGSGLREHAVQPPPAVLLTNQRRSAKRGCATPRVWTRRPIEANLRILPPREPTPTRGLCVFPEIPAH